jgi:hypothetical protein
LVNSYIEDQLETSLTSKQTLFVEVVELLDIEKFLGDYSNDTGRPFKARLPILKSFILKAVYNLDTTLVLIDMIKSSPTLRRLCGWERIGSIPSESTFSRAFAEFSNLNITSSIHENIVIKELGDDIAHHASKDSTSIKGREKACRKNKKTKDKKKKKNKSKEKKLKKVEIQVNRTLEENVKDLPTQANWGAKKNSKGKQMSWCGYKLHLDCVDGDIPVSVILTSASVHDSQVAIPLMQQTNNKMKGFYDLMDAAYDSPSIHEFSESLGHIPIIDPNKRKKDYNPLEHAKKNRYNERSTVERVNSYLKDSHGGKTVRVKGHTKVYTHLMFGILVITAKQILALPH